MSKPVKSLITESYKRRFADLEGAVLIDIRGISSNQNNELRAGLAGDNIRVTVVKNNLARQAVTGSALEQLSQLFEGPSALVFGGESVVNVARAILDQVKKNEKITVKGAIMDGVLFPADQVEALSKYPTRPEAQAQVIQIFLSPAAQIIGAALSAGGLIASILSTIEEKLEKGEAIAKSA